ncbi:MAG: ABC-type transport auxiliary lipoprotein family protein [Burkholderiaceae bacterium]
MTTHIPRALRQPIAACFLWLLATALLGGCSVLKPSATSQPRFYALGPTPGAPAPDAPRPLSSNAAAPTLLVLPPGAAAGFDSQRIIYIRQDHQIEYFAHNEWVDTPSRMLQGVLIEAMSRSGVFSAVSPASGAAGGDIRLDTEIVRLQHEFLTQPSQVRFTLRATLVEDRSRRVLAWREFDTVVPASSDDPYGGVTAASAAVQQTMQQLTVFSRQAIANWTPRQ